MMQSMQGEIVGRSAPPELSRYTKVIAAASMTDEDNPYVKGTGEWQAWHFGQGGDPSVEPVREIVNSYDGPLYQGPYQAEWFYAGYNAFIDGALSNPCIQGSPEWRGWQEGWNEAYAHFGAMAISSGSEARDESFEAMQKAGQFYTEDSSLTYSQVWRRTYDEDQDAARASRVATSYANRSQSARHDVEYWDRYQRASSGFYRGEPMYEDDFFSAMDVHEGDIRWLIMRDDPDFRGDRSELEHRWVQREDINIVFEEDLVQSDMSLQEAISGTPSDSTVHPEWDSMERNDPMIPDVTDVPDWPTELNIDGFFYEFEAVADDVGGTRSAWYGASSGRGQRQVLWDDWNNPESGVDINGS